MWCDQAKSVGSRKYWFWDMAKQRKYFLLLLLFWKLFNCWYLLNWLFNFNGVICKCSFANACYNPIRNGKIEYDRLQTDFAWSHHKWQCWNVAKCRQAVYCFVLKTFTKPFTLWSVLNAGNKRLVCIIVST